MVNSSKRIRDFPSSMRGAMLLLVLAAIVPLLAVQAGTLSAWYYSRLTEERLATEEQARAVASQFGAFVRDLHRDELAIGSRVAELASDAPERANRFLSITAREYPAISSYHWCDPKGTVVASSEPKAIGLSLADRPYFKDAMAGRDWTASDRLTERASGHLAFVVARPVRAEQGRVVGVLVAAVNLVDLDEQAMPAPRDENFSIWLFDRQGTVVYRSPNSEKGFSGQGDATPFLAAGPEGQAEQSGTLVAPASGEKYILARVPIAEIGWVAGASLPMKAAMADVYRGLWVVAGLNLLVVAVSGIVAARTRRTVVDQLQHLRAQAEAVGRGEAAEPADQRGIRELTELASAFHRMDLSLREARDELQKANAELERRVQERTAQLAAAVGSLKAEVEERQRVERRDALTGHLLELFARKDSRKEYLDAVAQAIRDWSGCRCVGIRVVDSQRNIPYESFVGFSREFWERENCLSLERDACFCVRAVLQTPEPQDMPLRTPGGSFRCEHALEFVEGLSPESLARYRGECMRAGFNSLAIVPVFYRGEPLGAIHLADERDGAVPLSCVEFLESMAPLIGEAIHRFNVEGELRGASLYARSLIEASLDPLVTISPDGRIMDVNRATELATGVDRAHLIGTDFSSYFTDPERADAGYREVLAQGFVTDYPLTVRHTSGRTIDVLYNATVFRNEAGEVQGVFAAARDVTERNRMERELRIASLYARSLLEASLDPLVTISPAGQIMDVNRATEMVTGVDRTHLVGTDFSSYFTDPEKADAGYREVLARGFVTDYPLTIRHASGRTTDVLYNATVFRNEAGEVQGVFAAARDVTARKRAEKELELHRQHLEELVAQRTEELRLSNEQLQQEIAERKQAAETLARTAEELARSNKELEQFAYVASHDLQEPLRVVTGYVQLIERRFKGHLDADAEQFVHYIVDGVSRMQQLITDLLNYSRVGTRGKAMEPTSAEAVLGRVLGNLQKVIADTGAAVSHDPLPTVRADETQLMQLFQNLIGNAIKFRGQRQPEIRVAAERNGSGWLFSVRDNGIGIEKQYWDQVFVIFQRLHTRQKYPGTGIGLAICKRIVERHGGRIWIDSTPGQGTTFYFTLS